MNSNQNSRKYAWVLPVASIALLATAIAILSHHADPSPSLSRKLFGMWRALPFLASAALLSASALLMLAVFQRSAAINTLIGMVAIFASLALLETLGHVAKLPWSTLFIKPLESHGWDPEPLVRYEGHTYQDTAFAWGLRSEPIYFSFETDRRGFRNPVDREAADIYLIGDSMIVGALVPVEEIISTLIERKTGAATMQIALIGKGPQQMVTLFEAQQLDVKGSTIILFVFEGNDLLDSKAYLNADPTTPQSNIKDHSLLFNLLIMAQKLTQPVAGEARLRVCNIAGTTYTFGWVRNSFDGLDDHLLHIAQEVSRFKDEVVARGASFVLAFIPSKFRALAPLCTFAPDSELADASSHIGPMKDFLSRWSRETGTTFVDLTPHLRASAFEGAIPWFWGDTHWNEYGHRAAATALIEMIPMRRE